jgi:hypothetical protein
VLCCATGDGEAAIGDGDGDASAVGDASAGADDASADGGVALAYPVTPVGAGAAEGQGTLRPVWPSSISTSLQRSPYQALHSMSSLRQVMVPLMRSHSRYSIM